MSTGTVGRHLGAEDLQRLEHKARARVTWGDSRQDVERLLRSKGMDPRGAKQMLDRLYTERARSIREKGMRDLGVGGGLVAVGLLIILGFVRMGTLPLYLVALLGVGMIYGAFMMLRGFGRVQNPHRERDADTIFNG